MFESEEVAPYGSVRSIRSHQGSAGASVPVLPGNDGRTDQAFVVTPDELRIEILEDKNPPKLHAQAGACALQPRAMVS